MSESTSDADGRSSLASITRGASMFFFGRLLSHGLKFGLSILLTRTLGASLYGIYAFATTILSFAIILARMGSGKSLLKFIPSYEDQPSHRNRLVGLAYLTALLGSTFIGGVLYISAPKISSVTLDTPLLVETLRILSLALPFNTIIKLTNAVFRGSEVLEYQVLIEDIVYPVVQICVVGAAFLLGYSLLGVVSALALSAVLVCLVTVSLLLSETAVTPSVQVRPSRSDLGEFYNFSLPLAFKDLGSLLYNRVDILMVGFFLVDSSVGIYRVSVLLASLVVLPLTALNQLFPAIASRLYSDGQVGELNSINETVTRWSLTAAIPPALVSGIYSSELLRIFGPEFTAGYVVLILFVFGQLVDSAAGPAGYLLMMTDNQYLSLINQWVLGILNVVFNYFFIIEFGLVGAALATASILILLNVTRVVEVWYMEGLLPYSTKFWKALLAGVTAGVLMVGVARVLTGYTLLVAGSTVGVLSYVSLLLVFGIEQQDKEFFAEVLDDRFDVQL